MAEPNQPSELDPIQSRVRQPSQDQTPADNAESPTSRGEPDLVGGRPLLSLPENEPQASGKDALEVASSSPAPEGEFLTSPAEAKAQSREAFDRMRPYRGLMRGLTEKEWNSAGTRILILEHIARIENELSELDKYRSQYHEKDKESAVLRQKLRQATAVDLLFDFALAAGGTLVGLSTFLFDKSQWILGLVVLLIGLIFFISPLVLKYYQKGD